MSRNMALEKVGRARVAYMLQQRGWKVGEAFDDGYDLLAYHPKKSKKPCYIELKTKDLENLSPTNNLIAPLTKTERSICTHIIVYVEPKGWVFIAKKENVLPPGGSIFAALDKNRNLRQPKKGSKSFAPFKDRWDELFL